jgi:hypothetical protein
MPIQINTVPSIRCPLYLHYIDLPHDDPFIRIIGSEISIGQREDRGATVHEYTVVPSSMGVTVHKLGQKYS